MDKYLIAGKRGFLTTQQLDERKRIGYNSEFFESADVRDAHIFTDVEEAGEHLLDVTDGRILRTV
jgi:hypothetical protein